MMLAPEPRPDEPKKKKSNTKPPFKGSEIKDNG